MSKPWRNSSSVTINGGLAKKAVSDPRELRELTAFFAWTAWASAATRPGTAHSYTNNFPHDPPAGNVLTGGTRVSNVLALLFLPGGPPLLLLPFGTFSTLR